MFGGRWAFAAAVSDIAAGAGAGSGRASAAVPLLTSRARLAVKVTGIQPVRLVGNLMSMLLNPG